MTRPLKVTVRYRNDVYHAAVDPGERGDQLLLRSLYHFGIDPEDKGGWRLKPAGVERTNRGIVLDQPVGDQVRDGGELRLEADVAGNRRMATGSY